MTQGSQKVAGVAVLVVAGLGAWAPDRVLVESETDAPLLLTSEMEAVGAVAVDPLVDPTGPLAGAGLLDRTFVVLLVPGSDPGRVAALLAAMDGIAGARPDAMGWGAGVVPDDPEFDEQWNLASVDEMGVGAPDAWAWTTGGDVLVAVLDTGVDTSRAQLSGFVEPGWDFVNEDDDPTDDHGHGSAVASLVAARGDDGVGIAGLCWGCRILPVKVLDADNEGYYSVWIRGIEYAVVQGARVINLSLGGLTDDPALEAAVTAARDAGVVVVAAMMNRGDDVPFYPAAHGATIAVGATDRTGARAEFSSVLDWASSIGDHHDLCAPGVDVAVADWAGGAWTMSGTSIAAPHVSGVVALALDVDPDLEPEQVRSLLAETARDGDGLPEEDAPGPDPYHGAGRLDAAAFLAAVDGGEHDLDGDGHPEWDDCDDEDPEIGPECPATSGCGCSIVR